MSLHAAWFETLKNRSLYSLTDISDPQVVLTEGNPLRVKSQQEISEIAIFCRAEL